MADFKLIIAGGRDFRDITLLRTSFSDLARAELSLSWITIVSGMAKGADLMGRDFAKHYHIPYREFPADWKNLDAPGAVIRTGPHGQYNARAGHDRNEAMANFADGLLAFWDGRSKGTADMIKRMQDQNKFVKIIHY